MKKCDAGTISTVIKRKNSVSFQVFSTLKAKNLLIASILFLLKILKGSIVNPIMRERLGAKNMGSFRGCS